MDANEELALAGPVANPSHGGVLIMLHPGQGKVHRIHAEHQLRKRKCAVDNVKISQCFLEFMQKHIGSPCDMPWNNTEALVACPDDVIQERAKLLERMKMTDINMLAQNTGCLFPCDRHLYTSVEIGTELMTATQVFPRK